MQKCNSAMEVYKNNMLAYLCAYAGMPLHIPHTHIRANCGIVRQTSRNVQRSMKYACVCVCASVSACRLMAQRKVENEAGNSFSAFPGTHASVRFVSFCYCRVWYLWCERVLVAVMPLLLPTQQYLPLPKAPATSATSTLFCLFSNSAILFNPACLVVVCQQYNKNNTQTHSAAANFCC